MKDKEYAKQYYEKNKESLREANRKYREKNKDKIKEYAKQYYRKNKDYFIDYHKRNLKTRPCKHCKKPVPLLKGTKHCEECQKGYTKVCLHCGKEFFGSIRKRCCSDECSRLRKLFMIKMRGYRLLKEGLTK